MEIRNNLMSNLTGGDGAQATASNNLENVPASYFESPSGMNFHLTPLATGAIDKGTAVVEAGLDIDGQPHNAGAAPDIGADEAR